MIIRLLDKLMDRETIGHPDCPLMLRWTFFNWLGVKAMIHYFPEEVDDKDPHDHPRSFLTFVLRGSYIDQRWEKAPGVEAHTYQDPKCEIVSAPAIRFRSAEYMHIVETVAGTDCWTLVFMGPLKRSWGFLQLDRPKNGRPKWWPWERYVSKFGGTVRCDTDDGDRSHELERSAKDRKPTHEDYRGTTPPNAWDHLG